MSGKGDAGLSAKCILSYSPDRQSCRGHMSVAHDYLVAADKPAGVQQGQEDDECEVPKTGPGHTICEGRP